MFWGPQQFHCSVRLQFRSELTVTTVYYAFQKLSNLKKIKKKKTIKFWKKLLKWSEISNLQTWTIGHLSCHQYHTKNWISIKCFGEKLKLMKNVSYLIFFSAHADYSQLCNYFTKFFFHTKLDSFIADQLV